MQTSGHPTTRRRLNSALGAVALLGTLSGCQSITGSPNLSQVRIVDASTTATGVDVYQGAGALAYNLGLGTITSYVPLTPGNFSINVDGAGTRQQLATQGGTFLTGQQYTVLISNYLAGLQETILEDQSHAAPSGQVSLRVIDASTRAGALDIYLIPAGSSLTSVRALLSAVSLGENSGYLNVPAGTYTLVALPAGATLTAAGSTYYTGAAVTYVPGAAKTLILIDQQLVTVPGIQVITGNDYDPVAATS